jgi:hypothetical protein
MHPAIHSCVQATALASCDALHGILATGPCVLLVLAGNKSMQSADFWVLDTDAKVSGLTAALQYLQWCAMVCSCV